MGYSSSKEILGMFAEEIGRVMEVFNMAGVSLLDNPYIVSKNVHVIPVCI